ncbi:MAG: RnfABCDGE type electron transport complex subunit D [Candidatus Nomurabacteria bacterium]|nr:RnfABCDGE type electron transport complex subunit D [Candidatus Nomurabacteria bacterium]
MNHIDNFLNKITMYRIVLYILMSFFIFALLLSVFKFLPYTPLDLISSLLIILFISWISNLVFSYAYDAPTNVESVYITALILFFIITPAQGGVYTEFLPFAIWASIWAMASKYIFAIGRKHLFNPAAFAVVLTAFTINQFASWWIGTPTMLPIVLIGGFLVIRKIRRADLFFSFIVSALITVTILTVLKGSNIPTALFKTMANSAFFFFAFIMLTEPLTAPTTRWLRVVFGIIVGALFTPSLHIGGIYSSPELALVIGNIFAYLVSPKEKLFLKLKDRVQVATDTFDFIFTKDQDFSFKPGQYMEWTLKHRDPDSRGNRRYFTLASSPTEQDIHLGVKFYPEPSSFKNHLLALPVGGEIIVAQKSGDFVLPKEKGFGLVFIAGGIGVTPFRSMVQYLIDKKEKRNITVLYSNKKVSDIAYKDVFDRAQKELGIKTVYSITDKGEILTENMQAGFINAQVIAKEIPNYLNKIYYISGPHSMVDAFENTLKSMGVPSSNIKIDFFPGFA